MKTRSPLDSDSIPAFAIPVPLAKTHGACGLSRATIKGYRTHYFCRVNISAMAKPPSPPSVKPAFYKNPSKAIEKGGGFFIPGLRGPRLRYFVFILASCLLALNHIASPSAHTTTQTTSEIFAAFSLLAVLATAVADSVTQVLTTQSPESKGHPSFVQEAVVNKTAEQERSLRPSKEQANSETVAWALEVCRDLTTVSHIAAFRNGKIITATANVDMSKPDGPVIQRVREESRPFYIPNTKDLPVDVTLPFLSPAPHCLFVVPVSDCVVSFSTELLSSKSVGFSIEERRWLAVFAPRIVGRANP